MLLDEKTDEEIKRAISDYNKVRKNHRDIKDVNHEIIDELSGLEYLTEFIGLERIEDEERKTREKLKIYESIKDRFAKYIGIRIFRKVNFSFKIPHEAYALIGRQILDHNP